MPKLPLSCFDVQLESGLAEIYPILNSQCEINSRPITFQRRPSCLTYTSEYVCLGQLISCSYTLYKSWPFQWAIYSNLNWIFDSSNLCTFKRSAYHLPFNEYPYQSHFQHPPRYSQRSVPRPYPFKQPFPPHPPTFSTHPSSLRRRPSCRSSPRVQRHVSSLHSRATTLKKRRRPLTTQPPASYISEVLSSIQLASGRPHDWRSGYKPPSKSYFRRHFERFTAPFALTSMFLQFFDVRVITWIIFAFSDTPLYLNATCKPQFFDGSDTSRST